PLDGPDAGDVSQRPRTTAGSRGRRRRTPCGTRAPPGCRDDGAQRSRPKFHIDEIRSFQPKAGRSITFPFAGLRRILDPSKFVCSAHSTVAPFKVMPEISSFQSLSKGHNPLIYTFVRSL